MPDQPERSNLDEVFRDFRDEVSRQTAADEAEQHYKVAMTYREMGMLDDAVRELELAARAPEKLLSIHCPDGFYSGTSKTGHTAHVQKGNQNNSNNVLFCSFTFKSGLTIQNVNNHHLLYLRTVEQYITH